MKPINPGRFRERVALQRRVVGVDALGQESTSWADVATLWAEVLPIRGREYFAASQMQAPTDVRIRIRWRTGVEPTMRVAWKGQPHEVVSVIDPEGRGAVLELMCVAGLRDGRSAAADPTPNLPAGALLLGGARMLVRQSALSLQP